MREQPIEKLEWTKTESSNVEAICFDDRTQTICVRFQNGGIYSYLGPSMEIYTNLVHAPSIGKYLNNVIKAFPYTRWESEEKLIEYLNV